MRFGLLGPLQVVVEDIDTALHVSTPRLRALLAVLLWRPNQPVPLDELADLVWDGRPPGGTREAVRALVMRLRRHLDPLAAARIVTHAPGYMVEVSDDELDTSRAATLTREADAAVRRGRWPEASQAASGALSLWRGTPLIDVPSERLRSQWIPVLEQLQMQATTNRVEAELHQGCHEQLIPELRELTARHPLRESFHQQLMLALARSGRRAEALHAYQVARRTLAAELGVDPSSELHRLQARILEGDADLTAPPGPDVKDQAQALRMPPVGLPPLPPPARWFVGRLAEVARIEALVTRAPDPTATADTVVILAVEGVGGVGKTALAVHAAQRLADRFPDGQFFIDMYGYTPGHPPRLASEALDVFLRALGFHLQQIPPGTDERAALLRDRLSGTRTLVVLDNVSVEAQVRPLLHGLLGCVVIVTSRRRLRFLGEANLFSLDVLPVADALELLRAVAGDGQLPRDALALTEIVELCGRLPLAVRIAGALIRRRPIGTLQHLTEQLRARPTRTKAPTGGDCDLGALLDLSYHGLTGAEQRVYRYLGLVPGPDVDRHATAALTDGNPSIAVGLLDNLVDHNLAIEESPNRYRLHDLIRLHARALAEHDPAPHGEATPVTDPSAPLAVPRQLPLAGRHFTGRATELSELDDLLCTRRAANVAVIDGPAGVGKTSLAVWWAHKVAGDCFPDLQLYVNLRGYHPGGQAMTVEEAMHGFLDTLGVPPSRLPPTLDAQAALYRSLLAGKRALVLLDNARDATQVRPLLPGTPEAVVVVTSRFQLTPLVVADGAHRITLDLLPPADARDLLVERLGADRVMAEPHSVNQIIRACAGLPLALAIVAARAQQFSLASLATQLSSVADRLDTLDGGDVSSQVRSVLSWSYTALTGPAARLFRLLGLPATPDISAAAAASLAGSPPTETREMLAELTRANLLTEPVPNRYTFHDLLRAYALELARSEETGPERRAAMSRLLDHYVHSAYCADRLLNPHRDPMYPLPTKAQPGAQPEHLLDRTAASAWLTVERPALLAALHQAAAESGPAAPPRRTDGFAGRAWRLAWCLDTFLRWQGDRHQRLAAWRSALDAAYRLNDPVVRAHAHRFLAGSLRAAGMPGEAAMNLERAITLYDRAGDHLGQAHSLFVLAGVRLHQSDPQQALKCAQQALVLYQMAGNPRGEGLARNGIGWYSAELGDYEHATTQCRLALTLLEAVGDTSGQAAAWDTLGYAYHHLAAYDQATECYRRSIGLYQQIGDRYYHADTLTHLGDTHLAAGNRAAAQRVWQQALAILAELGHPDVAQLRTKLNDLNGTISALQAER